MKLHDTAIERLIKMFTTYGGYREETRLREALKKTDFSEYKRQTRGQETILVLTEDLVRAQTGE